MNNSSEKEFGLDGRSLRAVPIIQLLFMIFLVILIVLLSLFFVQPDIAFGSLVILIILMFYAALGLLYLFKSYIRSTGLQKIIIHDDLITVVRAGKSTSYKLESTRLSKIGKFLVIHSNNLILDRIETSIVYDLHELLKTMEQTFTKPDGIKQKSIINIMLFGGIRRLKLADIKSRHYFWIVLCIVPTIVLVYYLYFFKDAGEVIVLIHFLLGGIFIRGAPLVGAVLWIINIVLILLNNQALAVKIVNHICFIITSIYGAIIYLWVLDS